MEKTNSFDICRRPQNLSVVFVAKEIEDATAGYWFEEKEFVGPTFQTVNFWVDFRHVVGRKPKPKVIDQVRFLRPSQ